MCLQTRLPEPRRDSERGHSQQLSRDTVRADARSTVGVLARAGYRCETALARKSMTEVWLARLPDDRPCVVKCATASGAADPGVVRLIDREWQFLAAAASPGVVTPIRLARCERGPVIVMQYLPNGDLVTLAGSHPRHWAGAMHALAGTLRALHTRGIVHRDVKPRNVLLDEAERATLIDFASAAYCGSRTYAGGTTAAYRAPFIAPQAAAAPTEDEYAFAAVAYELLAGRPPFDVAQRGTDHGSFAPLDAERLIHASEPAVRELVRVVNAALADGARDRGDGLAVFQAALSAIIASH